MGGEHTESISYSQRGKENLEVDILIRPHLARVIVQILQLRWKCGRNAIKTLWDSGGRLLYSRNRHQNLAAITATYRAAVHACNTLL